MLCKTYHLNFKNFTQYAHKYGLSVMYTPIAGLPEKYTLDGTLHDDVLTNKATYTIRHNPVKPEVAQEMLAEYRKQHVLLTIYDVATGQDKTMTCKPGNASGVVAMVKRGDATYWQLGDFVFREL